MAEGFAIELGFRAASSGTDPAPRVNPYAVQVMAEAGIDISGNKPERYDHDQAVEQDIVVTVCGDAEEKCPLLPSGTRRIHWPLPDPARAAGGEDEVVGVFREVRDEIRARLALLYEELR